MNVCDETILHICVFVCAFALWPLLPVDAAGTSSSSCQGLRPAVSSSDCGKVRTPVCPTRLTTTPPPFSSCFLDQTAKYNTRNTEAARYRSKECFFRNLASLTDDLTWRCFSESYLNQRFAYLQQNGFTLLLKKRLCALGEISENGSEKDFPCWMHPYRLQ